jgi:short subunit dehydrogenase-like uncharacterized protein
MCAQTKVLATSAGPFARYGTPVIQACIQEGIDYCDITGETMWVRDMVAEYDEKAKAAGSRVVNLCGHDSIPWDLSTYMLAKKLREGDESEDLARIDFYDDIKSAPSGGTLETAFGIMFGKEKGMKKGAAQKALGYDPLLKTPSGKISDYNISAKNISSLQFSKDGGKTLPHRALFFMAGVNAYAVKRSNALNGYGKKLTYSEGQAFTSKISAVLYLTGLALFGMFLYFPPTRFLMRKFVLPKPGEGPSLDAMKNGHLHVLGVAKGSKGSVVQSTMSFNVDPGYLDTARMLVESALALSLGNGGKGKAAKKVEAEGGVYTPGACQKEVLLDRLLATGTEFVYHETLPAL